MTRRIILLLLITSFFTASSVYGLHCLDQNWSFVDWYAIYKAPKVRHFAPNIERGLGHYYLDVNFPSWALSKKAINDTGTAAFNTLQQIYSSLDDNVFYMMYNDEYPNTDEHGGGGHTKGVVAFDGKSGFWLIHSVPGFPPNKAEGFSYIESGTRYGQSFLCVSLPYEMLQYVGKQLLFNEPHIYDFHVPSFMQEDFPVLKALISGKKPQGPPWYSIVNLQSTNGQKFTSFAKSTDYGRDLYKDLVAPMLRSSLLVETWMDGSGQLATNCSDKYNVYNVIDVALPDNLVFKRSKDHSKWATGFNGNQEVNMTATGDWTCIGDINRMHHQYQRGGGTLCISNPSVWKAFRQSVERYEKCNKTN